MMGKYQTSDHIENNMFMSCEEKESHHAFEALLGEHHLWSMKNLRRCHAHEADQYRNMLANPMLMLRCDPTHISNLLSKEEHFLSQIDEAIARLAWVEGKHE